VVVADVATVAAVAVVAVAVVVCPYLYSCHLRS